ncbi:hypothetical protein OUZ56_020828 [Daphnia magna]|uniref:Uncharacterized protein n=1 Tax=Daphnia magna TaxID=35525 RepID=A0ABQ9ZGN1_9CRUS|nr:hypothetical protein OUZ56_020828 [Daphnia magna]
MGQYSSANETDLTSHLHHYCNTTDEKNQPANKRWSIYFQAHNPSMFEVGAGQADPAAPWE